MTAGPSLTVIGENIHCTRVALRKGKRIAERDGAEAILYRTADGEERALPVTEESKRTKDYEEGRVKHVQVAIETAMETAASDPPGDPAEGLRYIEALVRHQERAGAAFLDLNVDEISPKLAVQTGAMAWLAGTVQGLTDLPLSIDSSSVDVIRAGLEAIAPAQARPMLNSASLERLEALDLARAHDCRVVVTAAGERGMPDGADARVANATRMVEAALARGFAPWRSLHRPAGLPHLGRFRLRPPLPGCDPRTPRPLRRRHPYHRRHEQRLVRIAGPEAAQRYLRPARGRSRRRRRHPGPGGQPCGGDPRHRPGRPPIPPRRGRDAGPRRALHGLYPRLAEGPARGRMSQPASKQETRAMTETERPPQDEPALRTLAMPADANPNGDIFGGWVLAQMDLAGGVVAARRAGGRMVTVAVEAMRFHAPIAIGDLVTCYARVTKTGRTSITVAIETWARRRRGPKEVRVTEGTFIYVAIDEEGRPRPLPDETAEG